MAWTVVAALVQVLIITDVFAEGICAFRQTFVSDLGTVFDTFCCFITPNQVTFFNGARFVWISAPVGTWATVWALWVARTLVHTINVISSANGFASRVSITSTDADVGKIGALISALLGDITVAT